MQLISGLIEQYGVWLWFALSVVLFVLETLVPGIHFLWFGIAAAITGVISLLITLSWQIQTILFAVLSVLSVLWVRKYARPENARSDEPVLNIRGAQYIGRRVVVEDAIKNGRGKVRVGDTLWAAEGEDAAKGTEVEVTGVNGTVLVVASPDWTE